MDTKPIRQLAPHEIALYKAAANLTFSHVVHEELMSLAEMLSAMPPNFLVQLLADLSLLNYSAMTELRMRGATHPMPHTLP